MIQSKIAVKNLSRQKRRSFLLGGALAFGILILTLVNGVVGGMLASMEKNFSSIAVGHIFFSEVVRGENGRIIYSISDDRPLLAAVDRLGIPTTHIARRTMHSGTMIYAGESSMRGLSGVDWTEENQISDNIDLLAGSARGMAESDGIIIPEATAARLNLIPAREPAPAVKKTWDALPAAERKRLQADWDAKREEALGKAIGETILVELSTIHGQQNLGEFRVRGIYRAQFDFYAYTDRTFLNRLIGLPDDGYNQFGMFLKDFDKVDATTWQLHAALKDTWNLVPMDKTVGKGFETVVSDLRKTGFTGSRYIITNINNELGSFKSIFGTVQMVAMGFFVILLIVIMVGITNTFRIVVYERTREIGTMRALGMQRKGVRNIFLLEALFLSLGGVAAGFILALVILFVVGLIRWNTIAELGFFFDRGHLLVTVDPVLFLGTVVVVAGLTLLAALVPARRAAKLEPATALRTHF